MKVIRSEQSLNVETNFALIPLLRFISDDVLYVYELYGMISYTLFFR